ncbi:hypothetical protein [Haliscomenobacter sp.]|uniref:hypothetical protein n=1 Tax=Haliscomenobacter sp. TaxID=2717303 RepID=UPI003364EC1D
MTLNDILIFFGQLVSAVMIIPIVMALTKWQYLDKSLKIFFCFCVASFTFAFLEQLLLWHTGKYWNELWEPIFTYWQIGDTNFLQILFYLRDFLFLGWFYSAVLYPRTIAKWIRFIAIFLSIANIINYIFIEGYIEPGVFNPTSDAMFSFLVPMIGLWYIYHDSAKIDLYKNPVFWISIGLILPNLLGLFMFFTADYIQKADFALYVKLMLFTNFFQIIGIILLTIGFAHAYYMRFFYPESSK